MAKYSSTSVTVLVDGYDLTAALTDSISRGSEGLTQQTNPFGSTSEAHTPTGMQKGSLSVGGGFFDEAVDALHAGIAGGGVGVSRIICLSDQGQTKAKHFTGWEGVLSTKYEVIDSNGSLTKANVTYQVSGTIDADGVILQEQAAKTGDWDTTATPVDAADDPIATQIAIVSSSIEVGTLSTITTTGNHNLVTGDVVAIFDHTSVSPDINDSGAGAWQTVGHTVTVTGLKTFTIAVDVTDAGVNGYCVLVSRARGGYGYLQVTAGSGFTNFVGTIKHSVDGSTWATLVTFADTLTDFSTAQRVATATTTTQVRRYLSFDGNTTGSGSITVFAGFARSGM
jgi:hypothetical protein